MTSDTIAVITSGPRINPQWASVIQRFTDPEEAARFAVLMRSLGHTVIVERERDHDELPEAQR